jgi:hypothetical protein
MDGADRAYAPVSNVPARRARPDDVSHSSTWAKAATGVLPLGMPVLPPLRPDGSQRPARRPAVKPSSDRSHDQANLCR